MRKLKRNKNFIPEEFYKKKEKLNAEFFKKIICLCFILNLLLIPNTVSYFKNIGNDNRQNLNPIDYSYNESYDVNEINIWINSVFTEKVLSAQINNNAGEITLNDLDDFYNSNLKEKMDVTYISSEAESYKVGIKLHE